jgi:tRNA(Arg) A34 adenosine deaminase TadA
MLIMFLPSQMLFADAPCREPTNAAEERDNIFTLLAYAVVLKDWQDGDMEHNRGYNIGSVLVDPNNKVVYWARNAVNITKNMTQHGEVRLMTCYLGAEKTKNLMGYTIYTTLEPCAMCSGMMMLTSIPRTVYGETDLGYGKALERLELDSTKLTGGYPAYPRVVSSVPSIIETRCVLESLYDKYKATHPNPHITDFLATDEARKTYAAAFIMFMNYKIKYPENQAVLAQAQAFYKTVPAKHVPCCSEECP